MQLFAFINKPRTGIQLQQLFFGILALTILGFSSVAQAGTPCPQGSEGDRPFNWSNLKQCVWTNYDGNLYPVLYKTLYANIYCPGRMTQHQAEGAAQKIVDNKTALVNQSGRPASPNIVVLSHNRRRLDPVLKSVPHRFQYGCVVNGKSGVATHIKLQITAEGINDLKPGMTLNQAGKIMEKGEAAEKARFVRRAKSCSLVNRSGGVGLNGRLDQEYRCQILFQNNERTSAKITAAWLLKRDTALIGSMKAKHLSACLLQSTDIQCAPCTRSNKLVARVQFVAEGARCPSGTFYGKLRDFKE